MTLLPGTVLQNQGSLISGETGGIYVRNIDPNSLADRLGEVIAGAIVRARDEFDTVVLRASPSIAPYVTIDPPTLIAPAGQPFSEGNYRFTITRRISPKSGSPGCAPASAKKRFFSGTVDFLVDGGLIGQVYVSFTLPPNGSKRRHHDGCTRYPR